MGTKNRIKMEKLIWSYFHHSRNMNAVRYDVCINQECSEKNACSASNHDVYLCRKTLKIMGTALWRWMQREREDRGRLQQTGITRSHYVPRLHRVNSPPHLHQDLGLYVRFREDGACSLLSRWYSCTECLLLHKSGERERGRVKEGETEKKGGRGAEGGGEKKSEEILIYQLHRLYTRLSEISSLHPQ